MTKQLNKKGTSLVELIAVIVIMGIIAGIAVPTTIAVINRQKKNAAARSAESAVTALKNVILEAQADKSFSGAATLLGSVTYGNDYSISAFTITKDGGTATDVTSKYDINVDNLKAIGTFTVTLTISNGSFTYTPATAGTGFTVDGYQIAIDSEGSCTASSAS